MADEAEQDVQQAEETAPESSPETNQPEQDAPVSEDVTTQPSSEGGGGAKTVPFDRFKEVNDKVRAQKEIIEELKKSAPSMPQEQPAFEPPVYEQPATSDAQAQAREQLKGLMKEAYEEMSRPEREQAAARSKYKDFDEMKPFVEQVLDARPDLKNTVNSYETAYMLAKGMLTSHAAQEAKQVGKQEAYKTIDQKVASRPGSSVPKQEKSGSDLLSKFQSGQLSNEQVRANWSKIQQEMAQ